MQKHPEKQNTCAVMVTYHPDELMPDRIGPVLSQVHALIIVDNHSHPNQLRMLRETAERTGSTLIANSENLGVAAALNLGVRKALDAGYEWVLTLDQDTTLNPEYVSALSRACDAYQDSRGIAVIGANFSDIVGGRVKTGYVLEASPDEFVEVPTVITSGSLLSMAAFRNIGPFREEFFIDHVDHDFCLRARRLGYRVVLATASLMHHSIGSVSYHRFLGKWLETSNHSALRRYYWHRNGFALAREYLVREPAWALKILFFYFPTGFVNLILFEKQRLGKIRNVARGIWDGLLGRYTSQHGCN